MPAVKRGVKQSVKNAIIDEIHRQARRNYPTRKFEMHGLNHTHQSDLIDMQSYQHENKGFRFILIVIDVFSKFCSAQPIKTKKAAEVTAAYERILKESGRVPQFLQSDHGAEFFNSKMNMLLKKYRIKQYSTFSNKKASIVERLIRTIKMAIYRSFHQRSTHRWFDNLQEIVNEYNKTPHTTLKKRRPCDITEKDVPYLMSTVYNYAISGNKSFKFKINDIVRISKNRHTFHKGYLPSWTSELFKITARKNTLPVMYYLEDMSGNKIQGGFYQEELQKTNYPGYYLIEKILKTKKNNVLVSWLGFDKEHNSWIKKKDIV